MMHVPTAVHTEPVVLSDRPALYVTPEQGTGPGTMLYFHGGAYVFGSPTNAMCLTANGVTRTGLQTFSLDYRLAPEHPFPAAVEDALAACRALLEHGVDPATIAFVGHSAAVQPAPGARAPDTSRPRRSRRCAGCCEPSSPSSTRRSRSHSSPTRNATLPPPTAPTANAPCNGSPHRAHSPCPVVVLAWLWHRFRAQLASRTRLRSRPNFALPNICRFASFVLVTCPSTCPELHAYANVASVSS